MKFPAKWFGKVFCSFLGNCFVKVAWASRIMLRSVTFINLEVAFCIVLYFIHRTLLIKTYWVLRSCHSAGSTALLEKRKLCFGNGNTFLKHLGKHLLDFRSALWVDLFHFNGAVVFPTKVCLSSVIESCLLCV